MEAAASRQSESRAQALHRPFVSVIVPTCNRRAQLQACVGSLIGQTYTSYEVIISDDASTDDTAAFMQKFMEEHPEANLRYLRFEEHQGANPARNRALQKSRGELIAFTDDDCVAQPTWLEKLIQPFSNPYVGAVVGMVHSPEAANIFELALKGTQRVPGPKANRLVGGNMCVRRALLERFHFDEDRATPARRVDGTLDTAVSGRGDEEGLFLVLKAEGYEQLAVPNAVVMHDHRYTGRAFFKQAFRGGKSAARLVYKYYLPPRLDLLPFILTYATLPLAVFGKGWLMVPAFFFASANVAVSYNELSRKGKKIGEWLLSYPVLLAYYHTRLVGYVAESARLRFVATGIGRVRLPRRRPKSAGRNESESDPARRKPSRRQ